jgi:hypothetical protein
MSSNRFATVISIRPKPSSILAVSIIGMHMGAILLLSWLEIAGIAKLILALAVSISLLVSIRTHIIMLGKRGVRQLLWPHSGSIRIEDGTSQEHDVELAQDSVVHPWIMVLNLIDESRARRTLVLLPDSGDRQVLRRLRVRLMLDRKMA